VVSHPFAKEKAKGWSTEMVQERTTRGLKPSYKGEGIHQASMSELIASPKRPVVQIAAGLSFLEKTTRVEDSVVSLEP